jgi:hypothetical protein
LSSNCLPKMRTILLPTLIIAAALCPVSQSFAKHSTSPSRLPQLFAEDSEEPEEGPPEAVIRKLAAMVPEQTFERGEPTKSDGKVAPKDTTVYPVQIKNAEGQTVLRAHFFKGESGKWSIFDEAGNVMHET